VSADNGVDSFQEGERGTTGIEATRSIDEGSDHVYGVTEDPELVNLMLDLCYQFDYSLTFAANLKASDLGTRNTPMWQHIAVFELAVKYQMDGLREIAAEKFKLSAELNWDDEDFVHAVVLMQDSTTIHGANMQLREIVLNILYEHIDTLITKEKIEALMRANASLAYEVLKRARKSPVAAGE
jgi:hypothetical protein